MMTDEQLAKWKLAAKDFAPTIAADFQVLIARLEAAEAVCEYMSNFKFSWEVGRRLAAWRKARGEEP
jgi:hypothetical protein